MTTTLVDDANVCRTIAAVCSRAIDDSNCNHSTDEDDVKEDARDSEEGDSGGAASEDRVEEGVECGDAAECEGSNVVMVMVISHDELHRHQC